VLGGIEAAFLYYIPRFSGLTKPDVRGAIWVVTPLANAPLSALVGLGLGWIAVLPRRQWPRWQGAWAAVGSGLAATYLGWMFVWFRIGRGILVPSPSSSLSPAKYIALTLASYFLLGFLGYAAVLRWLFRRVRLYVSGADNWNIRWLWFADGAVLVALSLALIATSLRTSQPLSASHPSPRAASPRNNVVVVVMDTVRADHLSCYGYPRPTTPNLDKLAAEGVLFEQAVAPTSWTLPSLASISTGLLPHQHGAAWWRAMASQPMTLAKILKARGYETAAFNANPSFGLAGWGLDQGFDTYADAREWLRHNFAATFAGQSIYQALFQQFVSFNEFDHLNAGEINHQVMTWLRHRSGRPYFLFINYMDAHRPYLPPAPYDHRFGRIPKSVLWRIEYAMNDGRLSRPLSAEELQDVIDGYDNSLRYLDEQIARLLVALRALPDAARTFVIVTSDHGEGFGEHGTYDHGWNLNREVLHVPLLVIGPQVPAGRHIASAVPLYELFATVLHLALPDAGAPVRRASLSQFWMPDGGQQIAATPVLSELAYPKRDRSLVAELSLCDGRWHYVLSSGGHVQVFDWEKDVSEARNLADSAGFQTVLEQLHLETESILARSTFPWRNFDYFQPLDQPGTPFFRRATANRDAFRPIGWPAGSSQAFFTEQSPEVTTPPTPSEEDLLRSLPYH
jgi:arylsulfatase A-like enzyme